MAAADPKEIVRNIGRRIGELRAGNGLTQEQLAEKLGFTAKYLQRIEAGRENLAIRTLIRIADVLGADVPALFVLATSAAPRRGRPPGRKPRPDRA